LHDTFELRSFRFNLFTLRNQLAIFGGQSEDFIVLRVNTLTFRVANFTLLGQRQQGLDDRLGRNQGDKLRVDQLDLVDFFANKLRVDFIRNRLRFLRRRRLAHGKVLHDGVLRASLEVRVRLLTNQNQLALDALRFQLRHALFALLDRKVVVATAQTTVTGAQHDQAGLDRSDGAQRSVDVLALQLAVDGKQNLDELFRERTRVDDGILRFSHLGGGDEFHRIGDFLRGANRGDAVAHFLLGGILDNLLCLKR
jgi:hypothetical protein